MIFDKDRYYNGYVAPLLTDREIAAGSELVETLKNGHQRVNRDAPRKKYPTDKLAIVRYSANLPEALNRYREADTRLTDPPLDHQAFTRRINTPMPDYPDLYETVEAIAPGRAGANLYHRAAEALLTAIFYPSLGNMRIEAEIHDGRKRIDILYDNLAERGFFYWAARHFNAAMIPVECKNYEADPGNPELDQLSGRFSQFRGQVGILVTRRIRDRETFMARCRDTAKDGRGFILPLDDSDLKVMAQDAEKDKGKPRKRRETHDLLRQRFDFLIN